MPDPTQSPEEQLREAAQVISDATGYSAQELAQLLDSPHLRDWADRAALVPSKTRRVTGIEIVEELALRNIRRWSWPWPRRALPRARTSSTSCRWAWPARTSTRSPRPKIGSASPRSWSPTTRWPTPRMPASCCGGSRRGDLPTEEGQFSFRCVDEGGVTVSEHTGSGPWRGAVELLAGVRRPLRAQGVSQDRAGHQSRARGAALPDAHGFPNIARCTAGTSTRAPRWPEPWASCSSSFPRRSTAGCWPWTSR